MLTFTVLLGFLIYFVVTLPFMIILLIVRIFSPKVAGYIGQPFVKFGFRMIFAMSFSSLVVKGKENIPKGPVLFVSNHRGFFDVVVTYASIPATHRTSFVAKKSIKKVPFLSWWMIILSCLFLDRNDIKAGIATIKQAIAQVEGGDSIFIMPEGTRSKTEEMLEFKGGSFKIATRTGVPVVPVAITKTDEVFENHFPWIHRQRVIVTYGEPIITKDLDKEEIKNIHVIAQAKVKEMYDESMKSYVK